MAELDGENVVQITPQVQGGGMISTSASYVQTRGAAAAAGAGAGAGGSGELGRRLLAAARLGDTALVLDLMGKGAPFTADWLGTSPLHAAAGADHADTCAVLLRAGVSRDCRTKVERTPLHLAAAAGHAAVAALLLAHGAAPDPRDLLRMTPLHWAAERGHADVARLLLRHGADPHALSKFHKTPRSLAAERRRPDLVQLMDDALKEREAERSVDALRRATAPASTPAPAPARPPDPIRIKLEKAESRGETAGVGAGAGSGGAAALLRRHGITLLPPDSGSTVLTALQSGRSVVLSDAGKLMLKESGGRAPVLLTATPVREPPRPGVKIFTLNNKVLARPKDVRLVDPRDGQLRAVQVSTGGSPPVKTSPLKAKQRSPAVKIVMRGAGAGGAAGGGEAALRAALGAAQRTVARLSAELRAARARLRQYEDAPDA